MDRPKVHPNDVPDDADEPQVGYAKARSLALRFPSKLTTEELARWTQRLREATTGGDGR